LVLLATSLLLPIGCGRESPPAPSPGRATATTGPYETDGRPRHPLKPPAAPLNVIVVVIDTLRADALVPGVEGGGAMPGLAALARQGVVFTNAAAPAPWTFPSLASLLTGRLPHDHGITGEDGQPVGLAALPTWAEILENTLGYETVAMVGDAWPNGPGSMLEGFRHAIGNFTLQRAPQLLERWVDRRDPARPFFLLLHTFEAHNPYGARNHPPFPPTGSNSGGSDPVLTLGPAPDPADVTRGMLLDCSFRDALMRNPRHVADQEAVVRYMWSGYGADPRPALAEELRRAYMDGVRWVDGLLAETVERLRTLGLLENALLVVTGDHGEAFGEHGVLHHGRILYDELLRVPLVLVGPAATPFRGGRVIDGSVGLVDLMPTFLETLRLPPPDGLEGVSLCPLARGEAEGHPVISEETRTLRRTGGESDAVLASVRNESWKFLATYDRTAARLTEEAYDLHVDPEERQNLIDAQGRVLRASFDVVFCEAIARVREHVAAAIRADADRPGSPRLPAPPPNAPGPCELAQSR
jgi:arylsulfatase A-like enzyme